MRMNYRLLRQLMACFCALVRVSSALGQESGTSNPSQGIIRSVTRLVQVSVIAQDKKGDPIEGLTRDDFAVFDNGKEQKISVFSVESSRLLPASSKPLPPNIFSNRWDARGGVPTSVTVILFDGLNTPFEDQAYARQQIIKFLKQLQPQDRVALYALGSSLHIIHDFTSDAGPLLEALQHYRGRIASELAASEPDPNTDTAGASDASDTGVSELDAFMSDVTNRMNEFYTTRRVETTLEALEAIANHVAKLPGRKNLIWVSGSFPLTLGYDSLDPIAEKRTFSPEIGRAVDALNNANLAIYPVDARGLMTDPRFSASTRSVPSRTSNSFSKIQLTLDTMNELADRTGGKAFYNNNDITGAVRSAIDDSRLTYVLGYYPNDVQWDKRFREIKVRVKRPGARVRFRRGYFAMPEEQIDEKQRKEFLNEVAWSPLDATGVGIYARLVPPPPSADRSLMGIALLVNSHDITLHLDKDHWVGSVDVLFIQRAADGKVLNGTSKAINMNLKDETYKKVEKDGLILTGSEKLLAGVSELRIVVRDGPSGSIGSLSVPLSKVTAQQAPPAPAPASPAVTPTQPSTRTPAAVPRAAPRPVVTPAPTATPPAPKKP